MNNEIVIPIRLELTNTTVDIGRATEIAEAASQFSTAREAFESAFESEGIEYGEMSLVVPDPVKAAIRKVLDLSTMHLTPEVLEDLTGFDGVVAYTLDIGYLLWVPEDPEDHAADYGDEEECDGVPDHVLAIQLYARRHGADYVLLDRDGPKNEELPTFNHR